MLCALLVTAVLSNEIVDFVNTHPESTWVATEYPSEIAQLPRTTSFMTLGTHPSEHVPFTPNPSLPTHFDARERWPGKLYPVRNQGHCHSCWAHTIAEITADRLSILGCPPGVLSVQDLISCDRGSFGCNGGTPQESWYHMKHTGITTEECVPYVSQEFRIPPCPKKCANGSDITRIKAKHYNWIKAPDMQQEIYDHGPISTTIMCHEDLRQYKSGIYRHLTGKLTGLHTVMIIGWGEDNGTPYWIIQNSWGPEWGEKGFFKMLRGKDECQVERLAYTGWFSC